MEAYSSTSQTVSELIAIGALTRPLVVPLMITYSVLVFAFGLGVWGSAGEKRALRFAAVGLIGKEVLGFVVTLFAPIHLRGVEGTLTDVMHGILTFVGVLFMLLAIGFGAAALGKRLRLYSIATFLTLLLGGVLTGLDQPQLAATLPTPWMGFGSASGSALTCFGSWYWPSLSYAAKWNGPKMTSMGEVILDALGLIARHAV